MQKKVVFFLLFLFAHFSCAQPPIEGLYRGLITQNSGGLSDQYYMELNITIQEDGSILGASFFKLFEDRDVYVKYELVGKLQQEQMMLQETKIFEEQIYEGAYFCYKQMRLTIIYQADQYYLQGDWTSDNCPNAKGIIKLKKEQIL